MYTIKTDGEISPTKIVTKARLLANYPLLWTTLLLAWCYGGNMILQLPCPCHCPPLSGETETKRLNNILAHMSAA